MFKRKTLRATIAIAAVCGTAGVIAGIAGSAAAPSTSTSGANAGSGAGVAVQAPGPPGGRRGFRHRPGRMPVHGDLVVPNSAGSGFDHVTIDNGKFKSLSGDQLTITEGTAKATYKEVTLTIPSNAVVRRNWSKAKLSDLQSGDRVHVLVGPRGTFVGANDASHQFPRWKGGLRRFRGPGGPPGAGDPGPPPGPPPPGA